MKGKQNHITMDQASILMACVEGNKRRIRDSYTALAAAQVVLVILGLVIAVGMLVMAETHDISGWGAMAAMTLKLIICGAALFLLQRGVSLCGGRKAGLQDELDEINDTLGDITNAA